MFLVACMLSLVSAEVFSSQDYTPLTRLYWDEHRLNSQFKLQNGVTAIKVKDITGTNVAQQSNCITDLPDLPKMFSIKVKVDKTYS